MTDDFLTALLEAYWFAPPVALWRAIELRAAAEERIERPLLDLGCGDGLIARVLFGAERGVDVGFDPWREQMHRAAGAGVYRHLDLAEAQHMPYADGAFATVFSNSVLEHIPDLPPVLAEAGRVLRPGGRFIFTVPSDAFRWLLDGYQRREQAGDAAGAEAYAAAVDARLAHHHYHSPEEWRGLLAEARMDLVRARYYIPAEVEQLWDRLNDGFGISRRNLWRVLASPRLAGLGYQRLLQRTVVRRYSRRWRTAYQMDVAPGEPGGGLLVVAERGGRAL
ncbi:MAG: class I SAM-dependent methyltransferase [Anaerolineales bacterium]|nr:class I SAM-dependent methyltransferase [Anaerolineales bacterium]